MTRNIPNAKQKTRGTEEEGEDWQDPHGVINPLEAKAHADGLDQVMVMIQECVASDDSDNLAEATVDKMKTTLAVRLPTMHEANMLTVVKVIRDKGFRVLLPRSTEVEEILEEILPTVDFPKVAEVLQVVEAEDKLSESDWLLLAEFFDTLEVAHNQLAMACSLLGRLSRSIKSKQLMVVLKASIHPLIQLNVAAGLGETTTTRVQTKLPEDQVERVKMMMTLDPNAALLAKEKTNIPTQLLPVTFAFKVLNKFGNGTTQRKIQEMYLVKAKQLAASITRKKYLGGADWKALAKKRKALDDNPEASTSTGI